MVRRLAAIVLAAWIAAAAFLFVWPREDEPGRADAVVVLSGGRNARLAKGGELVRRDVAPVLVVSDGRAFGWVQGNRLCDGARHRFRVVCFKPNPYSTQGEAEEVARLGRARGWDSVVVVTSRFHVFRARMLLERCFPGEVRAVGADYKLRHLPAALFWETGKLAYALTVERDC